MPSYRTSTVTAILEEREGLQRVALDGDERAYVLVELVGPVTVGDEVVVNTTGVDLALGTGGWHVVHWNLARRDWTGAGRGHVLKMRYTSLQSDTGVYEEGGAVPTTLDGIPVVACTLHSQVPCVAAAFKHARPESRVVYVMTDGGALPLALSDLAAAMTTAALVDGTITAGHAFGGDLEAVNVPSALTLARHVLEADLVVVAMGPGVVGTGTDLGTTALEAVGILDATAVLGGTPILALRASLADPRPRQSGLSHHSSTVLRLARPGVHVAVPTGLGVDAPGHVVDTVDPPDLALVLGAHHLQVTTMGRGPEDDPIFFATAGAAGTLAARFVAAA